MIIYWGDQGKNCFQISLPNQGHKEDKNLSLLTETWYKTKAVFLPDFYCLFVRDFLFAFFRVRLLEARWIDRLRIQHATSPFSQPWRIHFLSNLLFFLVGLCYRLAWVNFTQLLAAVDPILKIWSLSTFRKFLNLGWGVH